MTPTIPDAVFELTAAVSLSSDFGCFANPAMDDKDITSLTEYRYSPLEPGERGIRLFVPHPGKDSAQIEGTMRYASLEDHDLSYEALSYAWEYPPNAA